MKGKLTPIQLDSLPKITVTRAVADEPQAVAIDTSTSDAPAPTVSLEDAKKASEEAKKEAEVPGNIPKTVLPGIPTWVSLAATAEN